VDQGVIQNWNAAQQNAEIQNAFASAQEANSIFPGTVTGITFTNEYLTDPNTGAQILAMIKDNKGRGLRVGTRIHTCGAIWEETNPIRPILLEIIKAADFIYCNIYPGSTGDIDVAVHDVTNAYYGFRYGFQQINPNIEVSIGETGWPSAGVSFNGSPNNVGNLVGYWNKMAAWASDNKVKTQFFEAFDEPWKSDINNKDPNASNGM
jgi:exo-beta-1,3-glucanase (GH17 family)